MNKAQSRIRRLAPGSLVIVFGCVSILLSTSSVLAQRAEDIIFTPEKVKTIPGHGMSKGEYPYDEDGYYRKEWVSTTARSKVKSSTTVRYPIPLKSEEHSNYKAKMRIKQSQEIKPPIGNEEKATESIEKFTETPKRPEPGNQRVIPAVARIMTDQQALKEGFIGPYSKMRRSSPVVTASIGSIPAISPKTRATIKSAYHKVNSGDTLFAISRKYGMTVDALKKANGLTSDLIRVGQSLRLALAQHTLGVPQGR